MKKKRIKQRKKMLTQTLFPFQRQCIAQIKRIANGKEGAFRSGAIFAMHPGSGKTLMSLVAARDLLSRHEGEPILVVAEVSCIQDWQSNCEDHFDPPLSFINLASKKNSSVLSWFDLKEYDIICCSYDILHSFESRREEENSNDEECSDVTNGIACLFSRQWPIVLFDEAHRIRNDSTNVFTSVRYLKSHFNLLLTATPCNNSIGDVLSLLTAAGIRPEHGDAWTPMYARNYLDEFKKICASYLVRHERTGIDKDQYKLTRVVIRVPFFEEVEKHLYQETSAAMKERHAREIFKTHVRQKQVCDGVGVSVVHVPTKIRCLLGYIQMVIVPRGEKAIIFCDYKQSIKDIRHHAEKHFGRNLRVFSADGDMKSKARRTVRSEFLRCRGPAILVTTRILKQGVNIEAANHSIHFDAQWNPAHEEQETGRCLRPGQRRSVFDVQLLIEGTIDDYIWMTSKYKRRLIDAVINKDSSIEDLVEAINATSFDDSIPRSCEDVKNTEATVRGFFNHYIDSRLCFDSVPATQILKKIVGTTAATSSVKRQRRL